VTKTAVPNQKRDSRKLHIHQSRLGQIVSMPEGPVVLQIPDGPMVVAEEMPWLQSASLGFFFPYGSSHEPLEYAGITHFIEHLIFKGTLTRTPRDIALAFEGVGGMLNASTSKEIMNVYGRIGSRYVQRGFDVIADMLMNPRFAVSDIEKERRVILEEIRASMDIPEQYLYEEFSKQVWGRSGVARPIAGSEKSLKSLDKKAILGYFNRKFTQKNLVISVAGNINALAVADMWSKVSKNRNKPVPIKNPDLNYQIKSLVPSWKSGVRIYRRDVEQATVIFGFPAPSVRDPERYPIMIIESILGGGMGSRLFQEIREKLGIVYDIDLGYSPMRGTGVMTIDSATAPHLLMSLIEKVLIELTELKRVKDFLEGSTFLGMESSSNRMYRNALGYLYLGDLVPTQKVLAKLNEVTARDVIAASNWIFSVDKIACGVLVPNKWENDKQVETDIQSMIKDKL
jgi:predicted Zn-dependent peptidase